MGPNHDAVLESLINENRLPSQQNRECVMRRTTLWTLSLALLIGLHLTSPALAGPGDPFNGIDVSISIEWENGSDTVQAVVGDLIEAKILMGIPDFGISFYSVSVLANSNLVVTFANGTPSIGFAELVSPSVTVGGGGTTISPFAASTVPIGSPGPISTTIQLGTISFLATSPGLFEVTPFLAIGDGLLDNMIIDKSTGSAFTSGFVSVIPEPSTALLMAIGLGGLSLVRPRE